MRLLLLFCYFSICSSHLIRLFPLYIFFKNSCFICWNSDSDITPCSLSLASLVNSSAMDIVGLLSLLLLLVLTSTRQRLCCLIYFHMSIHTVSYYFHQTFGLIFWNSCYDCISLAPPNSIPAIFSISPR